MKKTIPAGTTSHIEEVFIQDSSATTGDGLTGLAFGTADLKMYYFRNGAALPVAITLADMTLGTWVSGGFKEISSTLLPGVYQLGIPDLAVAAGVKSVVFEIFGSANTPPTLLEIQLGVDVNVTQVAGDSSAATALRDQFNGTGLVGDAYPSTQLQVGQIGVGSAAVSTVAGSFTLTTGNQVNTYTNTHAVDGVTHDLTPSVGVLDGYYESNIGSGKTASSANLLMSVNSQSDVLNVFAWDWVASAWNQRGFIAGVPGAGLLPQSFSLLVSHTGLAANEGLVRLRFESSGGTVVTSVKVDSLEFEYAVTSESVGYANGSLWINTVTGQPIANGGNGKADNPVDSLTDAFTMAGSTNLNRITSAQGSILTFLTTIDSYEFTGIDYFVDFNGQQIGNITITGGILSGIATGGAGTIFFERNEFGTCTLPPCGAVQGIFSGTVTLGAAGLFFFDHFASAIAGAGAPIVDFNGVGARQLNIRHYSGGVDIRNMASGDTMSLEGNGQLIVDASCSDCTIHVRGTFQVTNNGSNVTVVQEANFNATAATQLFDASLVGIKGTGFDTNTDSLKEISDAVAAISPATTPGIVPITLTLTDDLAAVVPGAAMQIWSADGQNEYFSGVGDLSGEITTSLLPGDYTFRGQLVGYSISDQTITVPVGGGTDDVAAVRTSIPPAPPSLDTSIVFGYLVDIGGNNELGVTVEAVRAGVTDVFTGDKAVTESLADTETNSSGYFELIVLRNTALTIRCAKASYEKTTTVTTASVDIKDIP